MCEGKLLKDIEICRKEMEEMASHSPFTSEQVVKISTRLDQLLNLYDNQKQQHKRLEHPHQA